MYQTLEKSVFYHTLRKSQIVSKIWIFRKINKIENLNFQAKNERIIVLIDII